MLAVIQTPVEMVLQVLQVLQGALVLKAPQALLVLLE